MSICLPALLTKLLPACIGTLEVGVITPGDAVTVYLKDITINQLLLFQETAAPDGRVIVDLSTTEVSSKHSYEMWMTVPGNSITDYLNFTIINSATVTDIVSLSFAPVIQNGLPFSFPNVVLEEA